VFRGVGAGVAEAGDEGTTVGLAVGGAVGLGLTSSSPHAAATRMTTVETTAVRIRWDRCCIRAS
jgi:hypothetical protein